MPKHKPLALKDRVTLRLGGHPPGPYKIVALLPNNFIEIADGGVKFLVLKAFLKRTTKKAK